MRRLWILGFGFLLFLSSVQASPTVPESIHLIFPDRVLQLNFQAHPELLHQVPQHYLPVAGKKIALDIGDVLPSSVDLFTIETEFRQEVSAERLKEFFESTSLGRIRTEGSVEVNVNGYGYPVFEGKPYDGFEIDYEKLVNVVNAALRFGQQYVQVPAEKIFSEVVVHPDLQERGIREIIAVGESNFTGSSSARRQNIIAAAAKFNGLIVSKGKTFSFNRSLGSIDEKDGFVKELVIKGSKTEKELGGGVCQVSTTVFRAAFSGGLPIVDRRNHSYAVPYYKPYGLDATIYLGAQDFRFKNDTGGDILIQTFTEGDNLFFVFYGTNDGRQITLEGPFISEYKKAPDPLVYETEDLPEGETAEVSAAHDGFRAEWVRHVLYEEEKPEKESFVSVYRAWPARIVRGIKLQTSSLERPSSWSRRP